MIKLRHTNHIVYPTPTTTTQTNKQTTPPPYPYGKENHAHSPSFTKPLMKVLTKPNHHQTHQNANYPHHHTQYRPDKNQTDNQLATHTTLTQLAHSQDLI